MIVVVAHPDDEVLWFSSLLERAANVVLAFGPYSEVPDIGPDRADAVAALPYPTTFLALPEAGTYAAVDWTAPRPSPFGMVLDHASEAIRDAYERNFVRVREQLRPLLTADQAVFSHNPWGEYGHADHVLVFRALEQLRREIGFRHWVSPYVSAQSAPFARTCDSLVIGRSDPAAIDARFSTSVEAIYRQHRCWTWDTDWQWPGEEWFLEIGDRPMNGDRTGAFELIRVTRREPA